MYELNQIFKILKKEETNRFKFILIGDIVRKDLFKRLHNKILIDRCKKEHCDFIIYSLENKENTKKFIKNFVRKFKLKKHFNKISYYGKVNDLNMELVGVLLNKNLYYINFKKARPRPDISIERIGFFSFKKKYDEFGRGFKDFHKKIIIINPKFKGEIPLEKALKIIQIKIQTGFDFDKRTRFQIRKSLKKLTMHLKEKKIIRILKMIEARSKNKREFSNFLRTLP